MFDIVVDTSDAPYHRGVKIDKIMVYYLDYLRFFPDADYEQYKEFEAERIAWMSVVAERRMLAAQALEREAEIAEQQAYEAGMNDHIYPDDFVEDDLNTVLDDIEIVSKLKVKSIVGNEDLTLSEIITKIREEIESKSVTNVPEETIDPLNVVFPFQEFDVSNQPRAEVMNKNACSWYNEVRHHEPYKRFQFQRVGGGMEYILNHDGKVIAKFVGTNLKVIQSSVCRQIYLLMRDNDKKKEEKAMSNEPNERFFCNVCKFNVLKLDHAKRCEVQLTREDSNFRKQIKALTGDHINRDIIQMMISALPSLGVDHTSKITTTLSHMQSSYVQKKLLLMICFIDPDEQFTISDHQFSTILEVNLTVNSKFRRVYAILVFHLLLEYMRGTKNARRTDLPLDKTLIDDFAKKFSGLIPLDF